MSEDKQKLICPICHKPYEFALRTWRDDKGWHCEHDNPSPRSKIEVRRHQNYDASMEAVRMANRMKAQEGNEEVSIISTQDGSKGRMEKIPKKVVESIKEKVTPWLEE